MEVVESSLRGPAGDPRVFVGILQLRPEVEGDDDVEETDKRGGWIETFGASRSPRDEKASKLLESTETSNLVRGGGAGGDGDGVERVIVGSRCFDFL